MMRIVKCLTFAAAAAVALATPPLEAEVPATDSSAGIDFFESKIRPVLAEHCYKCHSAKGGKAEGGLALDTRHGVLKGGDRGAAVTPGKPQSSLLLTAISQEDPDLTMPPDDKALSQSVIADVRRWIEIGAPDPRTENAAPVSAIDFDEARKFWSLRPPQHVPHPQVADPSWPRKDLDYFVMAKLGEHGLQPSPDAPAETLLRRLYFDLIGLPPSPAARQSFLNRIEISGIDAVLAQEVDGLLASNRFGERWGRHWLDVARFSESSGKETNVTFPHAWRYRNYVIDSVNSDKPYDQFLKEQLAGDLLPCETAEERAELLIATGFLALGPKSLNEMNRLQFLADVIDEQIDTVSRAVMATSVACARCHDHKFDPYSMHDYYALAGVFASTKTHFGTSVAPGNQVGGDLLTLPELPRQVVPNHSVPPRRLAQLREELAALQQEKEDRQAAAREAREAGKDPTEFFSLADALRILWRTGALEGQLKTLDDNGKALPLAMGVLDREAVMDVPLLIRGEIARPGEVIPRGFPQVIELDTTLSIDADQSGRQQLADWLTSSDHPLTSRVFVNRVWRHLFGDGIVRTVDNFGQNGERPSHPELLDSLSTQFMEQGWSLKAVIREIVLSRTYRQSSRFDRAAFEADPENRLLWRANKRRLDAEVIRDSMLHVSGNLDLQPPESSLVAEIGNRPISIIAFDRRVPSDLDDGDHRSIYLPVLRDRMPDVLDLFDFAEPSLVTGDRETTNVPLQALYLMNSPFILRQAADMAARIRGGDKPIETAFLLCFGRLPDATERQLAEEFLHRPKTNDTLITFCQSLLCTAEFRNVD